MQIPTTRIVIERPMNGQRLNQYLNLLIADFAVTDMEYIVTINIQEVEKASPKRKRR